MSAYVVITREKTRNQSELDQYKRLAPASFEEHQPCFALTRVDVQFWKARRSRTSLFLNSPAARRRRLGITVRPIKPHLSTAFREGITGSSLPRATSPNDRSGG
jgi:hypothetical protein